MLAGAEPVLYVERGGKGLQVLVEDDDPRLAPAIEALAAAVERGRIRKLGVEKVNGEPVIGSPWEELLLELGFRAGPAQAHHRRLNVNERGWHRLMFAAAAPPTARR